MYFKPSLAMLPPSYIILTHSLPLACVLRWSVFAAESSFTGYHPLGGLSIAYALEENNDGRCNAIPATFSGCRVGCAF